MNILKCECNDTRSFSDEEELETHKTTECSLRLYFNNNNIGDRLIDHQSTTPALMVAFSTAKEHFDNVYYANFDENDYNTHPPSTNDDNGSTDDDNSSVGTSEFYARIEVCTKEDLIKFNSELNKKLEFIEPNQYLSLELPSFEDIQPGLKLCFKKYILLKSVEYLRKYCDQFIKDDYTKMYLEIDAVIQNFLVYFRDIENTIEIENCGYSISCSNIVCIMGTNKCEDEKNGFWIVEIHEVKVKEKDDEVEVKVKEIEKKKSFKEVIEKFVYKVLGEYFRDSVLVKLNQKVDSNFKKLFDLKSIRAVINIYESIHGELLLLEKEENEENQFGVTPDYLALRSFIEILVRKYDICHAINLDSSSADKIEYVSSQIEAHDIINILICEAYDILERKSTAPPYQYRSTTFDYGRFDSFLHLEHQSVLSETCESLKKKWLSLRAHFIDLEVLDNIMTNEIKLQRLFFFHPLANEIHRTFTAEIENCDSLQLEQESDAKKKQCQFWKRLIGPLIKTGWLFVVDEEKQTFLIDPDGVVIVRIKHNEPIYSIALLGRSPYVSDEIDLEQLKNCKDDNEIFKLSNGYSCIPARKPFTIIRDNNRWSNANEVTVNSAMRRAHLNYPTFTYGDSVSSLKVDLDLSSIAVTLCDPDLVIQIPSDSITVNVPKMLKIQKNSDVKRPVIVKKRPVVVKKP